MRDLDSEYDCDVTECTARELYDAWHLNVPAGYYVAIASAVVDGHQRHRILDVSATYPALRTGNEDQEYGGLTVAFYVTR